MENKAGRVRLKELWRIADKALAGGQLMPPELEQEMMDLSKSLGQVEEIDLPDDGQS